MKNQNNTILYVIGAIILIIFLLNYQKPEEGMISLKAHYYKDGVEVFPESILQRIINSLITPPGEIYDQIFFDIIVTNEGNVNLSNVRITNSSDSGPNVFPTALASATPQTLSVGESKTLWNSNLINTSQFETFPQPITFSVSVAGDYGPISTTSNISFDLTITPSCLSKPVETSTLVNVQEIYIDSDDCQHWSYKIITSPQYWTPWRTNILPDYTYCLNPSYYTEGGAYDNRICYQPQNVGFYGGKFWIYHPETSTIVDDYGGVL